MPYEVKKKGGKYSVVNKTTGRVHSTTTKEKAMRQFRLLEGIEHSTIKHSKVSIKKKKKGTLLK